MTPKRFGDAGGPLLIPTRFCSTPGRAERPGATRGPTEPPPRRPGRKQAGRREAERREAERREAERREAERREAERRRRRGRRLAAAFLAIVLTALTVPPVAHATDDIPTQWQIDARAEALQRAPEPAEKPVICIIDTGVTPTPDLDIVSRTALDGGTPDDVTAIPGHYGHGTTVAHMAAAKVNGWGSSGAFPHARIASVRIFDHLGQRVPWQRYVTAIWQCADVRPKPAVAVVAIGGSSATAQELVDLRDAINEARTRDQMSVVAAAGNGGGRADMPARVPEAFAVGAAGSGGAFCAFSARGAEVDLFAPGCGVAQAGWDETAWTLDGTSFAAPLAAGVLAALRAYGTNPDPKQVEDLLRADTDMPGEPHLDAAAALTRAGLGDLVLRPEAGPRSEGAAGETDPVPDALDPASETHAGLQPAYFVSRRDGAVATSLQAPRLRVRRTNRRLWVTVLNRPRGARVQVRLAARVVERKARAFTLPKVDRIAVRFITTGAVSSWRQVATSAPRPQARST